MTPDHTDHAGGTRETVVDLVLATAPEHDVTIDDTTRLVDDLGYQSLRLVELTMVLEETFGLPPFERNDLAGVTTVGDVVALLVRHRGVAS